MTLNQLEQFLVVARLMNISRAAEELYVSHSSISRNISLLEDELHTILINRDNKVTSLTKSGALLAERAEFIMQYISETKQEVRAVGAKASTNLKVISNSFEDTRILNLFSDFRRMRPDARIMVEDVNMTDCIKKLSEKKADIVFTFSFALPDLTDTDIGAIPLYEDEFVAFANEHSPICEYDTIDVKKVVCEAPLFLANLQYDFVSSIAEQDIFIPPEGDGPVCYSMEQMLIQIKYGGRWAIIPRFVAMRNQAQCKIIPLENADSKYSIVMCWNKQNPNPLINPFLDAARTAFDIK